MVKTNRICVMNNYLELVCSDVNARNCTNTRSAGVQLRRGHMIFDHYNLIKLQEASQARLLHQKMLRSLTIKLQLQLHCQNTRLFRMRLSAVELRKESQSTRLNENMHRDGILKGQC